MLNNLIEKHFLKTVLIVFALLLALVTLLGSESKVNNDSNPYFKNLPQQYAESLVKTTRNDTSYHTSIIENIGIREITVFKAWSEKSEKKTDFILEVYPSDKSLLPKNKKHIRLDIKNDASIYKFEDKTYGVWRKALPFINVDKVIIKEARLYKKQKIWKDSIKNPFKSELSFESIKLESLKNDALRFEANPYSKIFIKVLKKYEISHAEHNFTTVKDSLIETCENIDKHVINANITIAKLQRPKVFWKNINDKSKKALALISINGKSKEKVNTLLAEYIKGDLKFVNLFDVNKLAVFYALESLFANACNQNFYLVFNENTNLLEPFYINSKCLGTLSNYIPKLEIRNIEFITTYTRTLKEIAELDIYSDIVKLDTNIDHNLALINSYNPQNIFDVDILRVNQRIIKKSIDPFSVIKPELLSINKNEIVFTVLNMSNYPVTINELSHKAKKTITSLDEPKRVLSGKQDTVRISLPRSFENLFVSKKKKIAEFKLYKHINELFVGYSIMGLQNIGYSNIIPYQSKEPVDSDLFRDLNSLAEYNFIKVNEEDKTISFTKDKITVDFPLIIPKGYIFNPRAGTEIDIVDGGKIISYSPLKLLGNKNKYIKVFSSDKKGQGILILADGKASELKFVKFLDLTNPKHGNWSVTGAVTFYESPVSLTNVIIESNRCEDALNIVRTTFNMRYCRISKTQSDAFDGDFVKGNIVYSNFSELGNDAIDVSGSDLIIKHVKITHASDKGLSAGEDSKMDVNNVQISNSEIAVAGKDLSIVTIKNLKIDSTKLAFTAFQKKPEFGPSTIDVNLLEINNVETKYLIESSSSLTVNGKKIKTSTNVKDRMYGVEFGRSSAETRNSQ